MADNAQPTPGGTPGAGGDGSGTPPEGQQPGTPPVVTNGAAVGFDPSKVSDDDFAKVFEDPRTFNHPRFKQLNERAKEADRLQAERDAAENKSLEEQGKWKELAAKEAEKSNSLQQRIKTQAGDMSLTIEAQKAGISDIDAALKLADRAGVSVDDNGQVTGAADAIKALVESKPYLVGNKPPVRVGSPSNPQNTATGEQVQTNAEGKRIYKLSEIQDRAFYKENAADIKLAMREGRTVNDRGSQVGIAGGQQ